MRRRSFLRTLAAAAAGVAFGGGLTIHPRQLVVPMNWNRPLPPEYLAQLRAMIAAAVAEHDRLIEEAIFRTV